MSNDQKLVTAAARAFCCASECKNPPLCRRKLHMEGAARALDALAAAGRLVPDGWVCVPREPTLEMLLAADVATDRHAADCLGAPLPHEDVWTEMLAASPLAQEQEAAALRARMAMQDEKKET